ncbi:hypothetical protein EIM50_13535 [Pseudoxanthomonas sp. SGD-10]|nr:hypothetical protein EIM50_13535 [Pseudoxanthomonas sp. SGD-10]
MADVELLPLPEWTKRDDLGGLVPSEVRAEMQAYARVNVEHHTEALRAEVERLRRLVQERDTMFCKRLCAGTNADGKPRCLALAEEHARVERLRAEVAEWKRVAAAQAELHGEAEARAERLEKALRDAATSMQTIDDKAGRDEYLMTMDEVRGYANSRANAARAALEQEDRNG